MTSSVSMSTGASATYGSAGVRSRGRATGRATPRAGLFGPRPKANGPGSWTPTPNPGNRLRAGTAGPGAAGPKTSGPRSGVYGTRAAPPSCSGVSSTGSPATQTATARGWLPSRRPKCARMARLSDLVFRAELEMAATPEQVWEGLTNPELTQRYYFGLAIDTGLRAGREYAYRGTDGEAAQSGTVLEVEAPRHLRLTST